MGKQPAACSLGFGVVFLSVDGLWERGRGAGDVRMNPAAAAEGNPRPSLKNH